MEPWLEKLRVPTKILQFHVWNGSKNLLPYGTKRKLLPKPCCEYRIVVPPDTSDKSVGFHNTAVCVLSIRRKQKKSVTNIRMWFDQWTNYTAIHWIQVFLFQLQDSAGKLWLPFSKSLDGLMGQRRNLSCFPNFGAWVNW